MFEHAQVTRLSTQWFGLCAKVLVIGAKLIRLFDTLLSLSVNINITSFLKEKPFFVPLSAFRPIGKEPCNVIGN